MPTQSPSSASPVLPCTTLPYVEPLPLVPLAEPFDDPDWLFEPKYDGFRGLVYGTEAGCEIRSRRDLPLKRFEELWDRIGEVLKGREAILDGEIVSLDRQGKPVFQDLIRRKGFIAFAAFDLLWLDGRDLRAEPLARRRELLTALLPEDTGPLYKILSIEEHGRALFGAIRKMDLPGIVAKRKCDDYRTGTQWYRIDNPGHRPAAEPLRLRERARRIRLEG